MAGRDALYVSEPLDPTAALDTQTVTQGGEDRHRQISSIGGSTTASVVDPTNTDPASDAYGLPVRVGDGHNVALGAVGDATVTAGDPGTLLAILRRVSQDAGDLLAAIQAGVTVAVSSALAAGEAHIGQVGGALVEVSTEFTRPNDSTGYTAGDAVSDDTTTTTMQVLAGCARVNAGSGWIVGARLTTDKKSITPRFRVRLFHTAGATLSGDNLAYQNVYADGPKRVGYFDLPAMSTPADSTNSNQSEAQDMGLRVPFVCDGGSKDLLYVLEILDGAATAANQKFRLKLFVSQN